MVRTPDGPDARLYGKELHALGLHLKNGGTWVACNHTSFRQGGRVWLVNHGSDANTDNNIEQMINTFGDDFDRVVLPNKVDATGIPERYIPAELWTTNASGVVAYKVR